jgi:Zn-dependent protease with chaperone function
MHWVLILVSINVISFVIAFSAALVLLQVMAGPWRHSAGSHWTERARLAYAPGIAVLWLAPFLGAVLGIFGDVILQAFARKTDLGNVGLFTTFFVAMAGVLTVRYMWLRELWGPRVTFKSWLAGSLIVMLAGLPGFFVTVVLAAVLPQKFGPPAVVILCMAVLAVAFLALGGEIGLLHWLGVMKPAPLALTTMVERLAAQMNVRGTTKVFVLEWAQVNAMAWHRNRAVGFSRALLAVMTEDEVRAVAAHELAHLLEPSWVRRLRTAHLFAYLPLVPLARYGGSSGGLAAAFLFPIFSSPMCVSAAAWSNVRTVLRSRP